jgi:hypothetical protein
VQLVARQAGMAAEQDWRDSSLRWRLVTRQYGARHSRQERPTRDAGSAARAGARQSAGLAALAGAPQAGAARCLRQGAGQHCAGCAVPVHWLPAPRTSRKR